MTDAELIARLRELSSFENGVGVMQDYYCGEEMLAAADRIEAMIAERDEAMQLLKTLSNMNGDLSRDLYKTKLLLAKAVGGLKRVCRQPDYMFPSPHEIARETLAEIKGESHD